MLCDRRQAARQAFGVAVGQWFNEMGILSGTIGACDTVRIVTVEIETLLWMQQQFEAIIALEEIRIRKKVDLHILM